MIVGSSRQPAIWRPLNWLINAGYKVMLADSYNPYPQGRENFRFFSYNTERHRLPYHRVLGQKRGQWLRTQLNIKLLKWAAFGFQADVIHADLTNRVVADCVEAKLYPLIVSVSGMFNSLFQRKLEARSMVFRRTLRKVNGLILESPFFVERSQALFPSIPHYFHIPMGVDPEWFHSNYHAHRTAWRMILKIPDEAIVLLSAQTLEPFYRHHDILEAFATARRQLPKQELFLLFFKFNMPTSVANLAYQKYLEQEIVQLGVTDYVRWIPQPAFKAKPAIYGLTDIVLSYPLHDASPATLIEAAACEKICISCNHPSYQGTFIEEWCNLVESDNSKVLAEAMIELVKAPSSKLRARAQQGRNTIKEQYTEQIATEKLIAAYQTLLNPP